MTRRPLTPTEVAEAQSVFQNSLETRRVHVVEGAAWTNWIARFAAWLKREPPPRLANAVGLANQVFFPHVLRTSAEDLAAGYFVDMAWLIHELTHAWQFQHTGLSYIPRALVLHLTKGKELYDYGGADGLRKALKTGVGWEDFNPEQQGDIARHYYIEQKRGRDTSAWDPYIGEMRRS
jgi:hypothetical protein